MKLSLSSGKKDARAPPPRETKEEMKVERGNTGVQTETGLARWEYTRQRWLEPSKSKSTNTSTKKKSVTARNIDTDDVIERIFSQSGDGRLKEPVALGQMVDILIDFWEADGLYD